MYMYLVRVLIGSLVCLCDLCDYLMRADSSIFYGDSDTSEEGILRTGKFHLMAHKAID